MKIRSIRWAIQMTVMAVALTAVTLPSAAAEPLGTSFNYQGQLKQAGVPVDGTADFEFTLWNAGTGGAMVGAMDPHLGVYVVNGLFTVQLDFGNTVFIGDARWLQVAVIYPAGADPVTLSSRQPITPVPYALALPGLRTEPSTDAGFPDGPIVIGGFSGNSTTNGVVGATIAGGGTPGYPNRALGDFSTVSGGAGNTASEPTSTVGGGGLNTASGDGSTVGGGDSNTSTGAQTTVGGGVDNMASGDGCTVGGGESNVASSRWSTVPGGLSNTAGGDYSFAAGSRAKANHDGTFVWSDSTIADPDFFSSTGVDQFLIKAAGGVGINTNSPGASLHIGGTPNVDGIMFPDGTLQTTAAVGGGGSLWTESASDIFYNVGDVGIGTANPAAKLHIFSPLAEATVVQIDTTGEEATALTINATSYPSFGIVASATDTAILGSSPIEGGTFYATGVGGRGLAGIANAGTGDGKGVYGRTNSSEGYAAYFTGGRNYFGGNVGIGTTTPTAKLHIGGTPGLDGIKFPDGSVQTTAAVGGGGDSLWTASSSDIFYTAGNVGIGTSDPLHPLHVETSDVFAVYGRSTSTAGRGVSGYAAANSGETFGGRFEAYSTSGCAVYGRATASSGTSYGVRGETNSANGYAGYFTGGKNYFEGKVGIGTTTPSEDLHVAGDARFDGSIGIGIAPSNLSPLQVTTAALAGIKASNSFSLGGVGVMGEATAPTGIGRGVYGIATSAEGVGVYGESAGKGVEGIGGEYGVRGEANGSVGFSFGVSGRAHTEGGRGVSAYNSATEGSAIAVWGMTESTDGFGGFFMGNGYFRDALTIGGSWEPTNKLTVRDDPFHAFDLLSGIGVRDHTALIENEHSPGILQRTGVLALRAHSPIGGYINYITFYQRNAQTLVSERVGSIKGDGSGGIVLESSGGDYAEWLPVVDREEIFEPGDVVSVVGGRITKNTEGADHVMVISTSPIVVGNQPSCQADEHNGYEKVAFIGQVPVKVRGPVRVGDFIIPSELNDGTGVGVSPEAITPEQFARVIGQAWESSEGPGLNRVRAVVGQLPPDPTVARMAARIEELENETQTLRVEGAALRARLDSLEATVAKLALSGNAGK